MLDGVLTQALGFIFSPIIKIFLYFCLYSTISIHFVCFYCLDIFVGVINFLWIVVVIITTLFLPQS